MNVADYLKLTREARARADAAKGGRWETDADEDGETCLGITAHDHGPDADCGDDCKAVVLTDAGWYPPDLPTARFIASARTDVPALCDAVEAQHAEIERLQAELERVRSSALKAARFARSAGYSLGNGREGAAKALDAHAGGLLREAGVVFEHAYATGAAVEPLAGIPRPEELPDDVGALKAIVRGLDLEIAGAMADVEAARARENARADLVRRLAEALAERQWETGDDWHRLYSFCQACDANDEEQAMSRDRPTLTHADDCPLAALLREAGVAVE